MALIVFRICVCGYKVIITGASQRAGAYEMTKEQAKNVRNQIVTEV